jgi:FMN phosphatase YigB (HAD superfamily)
MVSRVVLMDFDGVLLRHPKVLRRVQDRVVEYVRRNVKHTTLTTADARRLNRDLYGRYGHTHTGMRKLFMPHARLGTFNEFVYDKTYIQELLHDYGKDPEVLSGMTEWNTWLDAQWAEGDVSAMKVFTNAPRIWPQVWLEASGMQDRFQEILGSDHILFEGREDSLLKPDKRLYERMEHYHGGDQLLYFVEDSPVNLEPLMHRPQWVPVLFDGEECETMT